MSYESKPSETVVAMNPPTPAYTPGGTPQGQPGYQYAYAQPGAGSPPAAGPIPSVIYDANGNAYHAQQPQYNHAPPTMVYGGGRNQAAIAQYQKEMRDNELGCSDICWFICCGPFALICCLPKWNASKEAETKLQIELAKPM